MLKVFYNFLINFFYLPYLIIIFYRKIQNKEHEIKFKEKIFPKSIVRPQGFLFWFHAASIGELNTIFPIVDFFLKKDKKYTFLITTVTLSSYNLFVKKYGNDERIYHQFLPYDSNFLIQNFFKNWRPNIVSFVDSEIWPNFFFKIKKEGLPLVLLNARLTKKTFKRWKILKSFATEILSSIKLSICSNKETLNYLNHFNGKNIKYFGNIKYCSTLQNIYSGNNIKNDLDKNTKIWCAISTHPGEEIFCGEVHQILRKYFKNVKTIIIPRHINRINKISDSLNKMGLRTQIKNENDKIEKNSEIILINYYGSVLKYYENFKQIFIGKSLIKKLEKDGGQNPIDAAKMGCFIFHGPYVSNFKEIYEYLNSQNISSKIDSKNILAEKLINNFNSALSTNNNKTVKLNKYSEEIFDKVIKEYENIII
tara:strand:- start:797 stop:2065 length:1269 start_codon:yes stop_codon:yes gene_type:complete